MRILFILEKYTVLGLNRFYPENEFFGSNFCEKHGEVLID